MPNEFVARNGIIALNNSIVTGSLTVTAGVTGSFSGSLSGTASYATNALSASYALNAGNTQTASFATNANSASYALNAGNAQTASFATNSNSASYALNAGNAQSSSFAATASSADNFTVRNTLTAQTIVVQTITSSTDFVTGSSRFGSLITNTHQFTGSVSMTGSLTVIGPVSASSLTSSTDATINGHTLGRGAGNAIENTAFGNQALIRNTTGNRNTAMGWFALSASNGAAASSNTAVGALSMRNNLIGQYNSGFGEGTLFANTSGTFNTTIGYNSLAGLTDGTNNVGVGAYAGTYITGGAVDNTTSDNGVYIGYAAYASQSNTQNEIVIGANTTGNGSNTVTLGNTSITRTILNGNVGIGTASPTYKLSISGSNNSGIFLKQGNQIGDIPTASFYNGLTFENVSTTNAWSIGYSQGAFLSMNYFDGASTYNRYFTLTNAGNVGIGTISPSTKLAVSGSIAAYAADNQGIVSIAVGEGTTGATGNLIALESDTTNNRTFLYNNGTSTDFNIGSLGSNSNINISSVKDISLKVANGGNILTGTTALFITASTANVGIGTASPTTGKLQINTGTANNNALTIQADAVTSRTYGIGITSDASLNFYDNFAAASRLFISASSNVGIGTITPIAKLTVTDSSNFFPLAVIGQSSVNSNILALGAVSSVPSINGYNSTFSATTNLALQPQGGNVGIGTTSPGNSLDITSSLAIVRIRGGGATNQGAAFYVGRSDSSLTLTAFGDSSAIIGGTPNVSSMIWTTTSTPLIFHINGSERIRIDSTGSIGIGTTAPASKLDIQAGSISVGTNSATEGTILLQDQYSLGHLANIGTNRSSGGPVIGYGVYPSAGTTNVFSSSVSTLAFERSAFSMDGSFRWYTGAAQTVNIGSAATLSQRMVLDNNGNLGIGTTIPYEKLEVAGAISATGVSTNLTAQGHATTLSVNGGISLLQAVDWGAEFKPLVIDGQTINLQTGVGSTTSRVTIDVNGKVGVGLTAPLYRLEVSSSALDNHIAALGPAPSLNLLISQSNSPFCGTIGLATSTSHFLTGTVAGDLTIVNRGVTSGSIIFGFGSTERARITPVGNVGIGTTSPSEELHVYGDTNATVAARIENINAGASAFSTIQLGSAIGGSPNRWLNMGYSSVGVAVAGPYNPTGSFIINYGNGGLNFMTTGSNAGTSHIKFFTSGSQFGTERMRIEEGGNVSIGLGSATASAKFHVSGSIRTDQPTGGVSAAASYRWGNTVVTSGLTLITTRYIEVEIDGVVRRVGLVA